LYFLQNLLLAVVYDTFRNKELGKFRSLFLHKREAIRRTYAPLKHTHTHISLSSP